MEVRNTMNITELVRINRPSSQGSSDMTGVALGRLFNPTEVPDALPKNGKDHCVGTGGFADGMAEMCNDAPVVAQDHENHREIIGNHRTIIGNLWFFLVFLTFVG